MKKIDVLDVSSETSCKPSAGTCPHLTVGDNVVQGYKSAMLLVGFRVEYLEAYASDERTITFHERVRKDAPQVGVSI
jgi:hypothetical protein